MKHILRFLKLIEAGLVVLCIVIILSGVFPGIFSWSTEEGKAHIQEFVDNIKDSADRFIADISDKTGWFQSETKETDGSDITGRADYKAPQEIGREISEPAGNTYTDGSHSADEKELAEANANEGELKIIDNKNTISADYGVTNAPAVFDTLYYPYFGILNADEQILYEQLYENMKNYNTDIDLKITTTASVLAKVFEAVYNDHPEIFWLDTSYQYGYYSNGEVAKVILSFNETADYIEQAKAQFDEAAQQIIQNAQTFDSDIEKERYIHDTLNELTEYDENSSLNQSAYSALVNHTSVCAGYSRAFQYLMQQVGIPCYYCVGYANGEHAWNIVYIDGVSYNVDVSWDDGVANPYEYFNLTDEEFRLTHRISGLSESVFAG